jgi:hypothetical protein
MKGKIVLIALASHLLLCAIGSSTQAAPTSVPVSVTLTSGEFTTTVNTVVGVTVTNIGGPANGPVAVELSLVDAQGNVMLSTAWSVLPGNMVASTRTFSNVADLRAVVRVLDQRLRPLVKPTAEVLDETTFRALIYIPSIEFVPMVP